jgi:hypothetical protein
MFNNVAFDVFIGLVFIFLLYSLLATIVQEIIATRFGFRAKVLEKAILRMLEDGKTTTPVQFFDRILGILHLFGFVNYLKGKKVAPWFYAHPLIKYLAEDNYYSKPAYLNSENFSKVMIDLLKGFGFPESQTVQSIHNSIMDGTFYKLPINLVEEEGAPKPDTANPAIKTLRERKENLIGNDLLQFEKVQINRNTALYLKSLWQESGADVDMFRKKLEAWFDDTMLRATGWYKRYTRMLLFFIGLIIAFAFNVDVISIHRILSKDKNAREQLVQLATKSQDQLSPMVEQQRRGEQVSDTLLQRTYNLVAQDANQASNILGLGRAWKDTCKMCDDTSFTNRMGRYEKMSKYKRDSISTLQHDIDSLRTYKDTVTTKLGNNDSAQLSKRIYTDSLLLVRYLQDSSVKEYRKLEALSNRCAFIKNSIGDRWFVYAPNQQGGWETLLGWLITALAVTLGAPFWFDLLSKLIKIRGTGSKIDSSTTDSDSDNSKTTPSSSTPTAPVAVNVNSNAGEEAVG